MLTEKTLSKPREELCANAPGRGTYVLVFHLSHHIQIEVGSLGRCHFRSGFYAYVGSAFGTGGLAARLSRHLRPVTRPHWHVDYLRNTARLEQIWFAESERPREHDWAAIFKRLEGAGLPVRRFGSSDCRCHTHLFHFHRPPSLRRFEKMVHYLFSADPPLQKLLVSSFESDRAIGFGLG